MVFQQDAVFQSLVPSLDLPLRLRMERRPSDMVHLVIAEPVSQFFCDIAGAIVRQQTWFMNDLGTITAGRF